MSEPLLSKTKADAVSNGVFLISLGMLIYANAWWPWILISIWVWVGLRQLLTARKYDFIVSTVILLGLFIISFFKFKWSVIMPVIFVIGGIFIVIREYYFAKDTNGEDISEEIKDDMNEK